MYVTYGENDKIDLFSVIELCTRRAFVMKEHPEAFGIQGDLSVEEIAHILVKLEMEKLQEDNGDSLVDYNDEIVSIEDLGEDIEMRDIQVSGNNTFYANGILTKNSAGIIMTADLLIGIIRTDELKEQQQVLFKQIKNRFGDPSYFQKFICGMDTSRMKVFDLDVPQPKDTTGPRAEKDEAPKTGGTKKPKLDDWDFG